MPNSNDIRWALATKEQHLFAAYPVAYQRWLALADYLRMRQPWFSSDWFTVIDVRDGNIVSVDRRYV